jgi:hypothetical protein
MQTQCSTPDCDRPYYCRGVCRAHYDRRRHGREMLIPIRSRRTVDVSSWFWLQIEFTNTCWLWTRRASVRGYGQFSEGNSLVLAHRYAYEFCYGPVPPGLELDHLCRIHACVNPDHLEAVTHRENVLRGTGVSAINARKTSCPRGHPYDSADARARYCLRCIRDRQRRARQAQL